MGSLSFKLSKNNNEVLKLDDINYDIKKNNIIFCYDNINYKIRVSNINAFLVRENDEFKFVLDIMNNKCFYKLKETNTLLEIKVLNSKSLINGNNFIIEYKLETEEEQNKIEIDFYKGE